MVFIALTIFLAAAVDVAVCGGGGADADADGGRQGKFLFNLVQFPNDKCSSAVLSTTNLTGAPGEEWGTCYTPGECTGRGGEKKSRCASGFGSCCVFQKTCNEEVNEPVAYFTNPSYPVADRDPNNCSFTVKITNPDVCQLRLDFEDFVMGGPDIYSSRPPYGLCRMDQMAIFSRQRNLGLSQGNLVCGDMTGQHVYIPVDTSGGVEVVRLFAMVGLNSAGSPGQVSDYRWNVKITQVDCSKDLDLRAPDGCLQYHTDPVGTLESFNWRMVQSPYPASLDYAICIKRPTNVLGAFCGISFAASTVGDGFKLNINGKDDSSHWGDFCFDFMGTNMEKVSNDYLEILNSYTNAGGASDVPANRFCGVFDGVNRVFPGITGRFSGPVVVHVKTDESLKVRNFGGPASTAVQAQDLVTEGIENGFRLTYSFTNNCPTTNLL